VRGRFGSTSTLLAARMQPPLGCGSGILCTWPFWCFQRWTLLRGSVGAAWSVERQAYHGYATGGRRPTPRPAVAEHAGRCRHTSHAARAPAALVPEPIYSGRFGAGRAVVGRCATTSGPTCGPNRESPACTTSAVRTLPDAAPPPAVTRKDWHQCMLAWSLHGDVGAAHRVSLSQPGTISTQASPYMHPPR